MPSIDALDYMLASERGVRKKFNLSNYCLQTDDEEKLIEKIGIQIKKRFLMSQSRSEWLKPQGVIWKMVFNFLRGSKLS